MKIGIYSGTQKKIGKTLLAAHLGFYALENLINTTIIEQKGKKDVLKYGLAKETLVESLDGGGKSKLLITDVDDEYESDYVIYDINNYENAKTLADKIDKWIIPISENFDVKCGGIDKKKMYLIRCGIEKTRKNRRPTNEDYAFKSFGFKIFPHPIFRSDWFARAKADKIPIWEKSFALRSIEAQNIHTFCHWVFKHKCNDRFVLK